MLGLKMYKKTKTYLNNKHTSKDYDFLPSMKTMCQRPKTSGLSSGSEPKVLKVLPPQRSFTSWFLRQPPPPHPLPLPPPPNLNSPLLGQPIFFLCVFALVSFLWVITAFSLCVSFNDCDDTCRVRFSRFMNQDIQFAVFCLPIRRSSLCQHFFCVADLDPDRKDRIQPSIHRLEFILKSFCKLKQKYLLKILNPDFNAYFQSNNIFVLKAIEII